MKLKNIIFSIVELLIINIPGGLGQRVRYAYYSRRFAMCGKNVRIDIGVIFQNPENCPAWCGQYSHIPGDCF